MKKWCYLVLIVLLIPNTFGNDFGFDTKEQIMDLDINVKLNIIPQNPIYEIDHVTLFLTYYPRESWQQTVLSLESNRDYNPTEDTLVFNWQEPAGNALTANLHSQVKVRNDLVVIKNKINFPLGKLGPEFDKYIQPTENIESDNQDIVNLASEIVSGYDDEYLVVHEIFKWVRENIEYDLNTLTAKVSQPASWVLENRYGVCDELTSLLIALVRSVGIPARYVSGMAFTNYNNLNKWGAHGWAEIYFPDYGWVPMDVTYGQFGFVDPTHIILKKSIDSNESSIRYEWKAHDVELKAEPMEINVELIRKIGTAEQMIQVDVSAIRTKIGFGSYNIIKADVKNLKDFYLATELILSNTEGIEAVDDRKDIVLKPNQEKSFYWMVKVSKDLSKKFIYTFPIGVSTSRGVDALSLFKSNSDYTIYTYQEMNSMLDKLKDEEILTYSKNIDIDCFFEQDEFYVYEPSNVICDLRNSGNVVLDDLEACFLQDCRLFSLGIARVKRIVFPIYSGPGEYEQSISVKNIMVSKVITIQYSVLDIPSVKITNIELPREVEYDGEYELKFTLGKNSSSMPVNIKLIVESNLPKEWMFSNLEEERNFALGFKGSDINYGVNNIKIKVFYYDLNDRLYETEYVVTTTLENVNIVQRIILFLRKLQSKLLSYFY